MTESIYKDIYEGNSKEAQIKFPFLTKGLHLKILSAISTTIGIFPLKESFYVATYQTKKDGFNAIIEETNSLEFINIIIKRETGNSQWLDNEQFAKVTKFLKDNDCKYID